jgi:hypothetical protein
VIGHGNSPALSVYTREDTDSFHGLLDNDSLFAQIPQAMRPQITHMTQIKTSAMRSSFVVSVKSATSADLLHCRWQPQAVC